MKRYIDKSALVAELNRLIAELVEEGEDIMFEQGRISAFEDVKAFINHMLEVKDPYEECIQYPTIRDGIEAHAETYSFNIESELFNQLTKEQQALWRKEIEQAVISGGEAGVELAIDPRYKENFEVKEVDTWHLQEKENIYDAVKDWSLQTFACVMKDGTIQKFTGNLDEDYEGHINVHIYGANNDYDNVDDIVKWIEFT